MGVGLGRKGHESWRMDRTGKSEIGKELTIGEGKQREGCWVRHRRTGGGGVGNGLGLGRHGRTGEGVLVVRGG